MVRLSEKGEHMAFANFCSNCGAKATGRFCANCGSKIGETEEKKEVTPETKGQFKNLKMTGFKYHRVGMSMGKYLMVIARPNGYDVIESENEIPWPGIDGGMLTGNVFMGMAMAMNMNMAMNMPAGVENGQKKEKDITPPDADEIYRAGGMLSFVNVSPEEGSAFFAELTEAGILSWDGFSESGNIPAGMRDGQDFFTLRVLFEDGQVLKASGSNAYPDGYNDIMKIVNKFFANHVDYSKYYPTEFPDEVPSSLFIKIGTDTPAADFYAEVEILGKERKWWTSVKDKKGVLLAPETFLVDVGIVPEETPERLQYQRFIDILKRHDMGKLNNAKPAVNDGNVNDEFDRKALSVNILYSGNRRYQLMFNAKTAEYKDFFMDVAKEILAYHEEIKDTTIL